MTAIVYNSNNSSAAKHLVQTKDYDYYDFGLQNNITQGWKIHLSAKLTNYQSILQIVGDYCVANQINFKHINNQATFINVFSKKYPREHSCKFITIYCVSTEQFKKVILALNKPLQGFEGPHIYTDKSYENSQVLHYRFGSFVDQKNQIIGLDGQLQVDVQGPWFALPDFVTDPFPNINETTSVETNGIFADYTFVNALQFDNSGGIYLVKANATDTYVVIKEVRKHILDSVEHPFPTSLARAHEFAVFQTINSPHFPKALTAYHLEHHDYYVYELIKGVNLKKLSDFHSLITVSPNDIEQKTKRFTFLTVVYEQFLAFQNELKRLGLVVNDVSAHNFLWTTDQKLVCVDLENAYFHDTTEKPTIFKKSYLVNDHQLEGRALDCVKLNHLYLNIFFAANSLLVQDPSGKRLQEKITGLLKIYAAPEPLLAKITRLIHFTDANQKPTANPITICHHLQKLPYEQRLFDLLDSEKIDEHLWIEIESLFLKYSILVKKFLNQSQYKILLNKDLKELALHELFLITTVNLNTKKDFALQKKIFDIVLAQYFAPNFHQVLVKNVMYPFLNGTLGLWYLLVKYTVLSQDLSYEPLLNQISKQSFIYFANQFGLVNGTFGFLIITYWLQKQKMLAWTKPIKIDWVLQNLAWHTFVDEQTTKIATYYDHVLVADDYFFGLKGIVVWLKKLKLNYKKLLFDTQDES